MTLLQPSVTSSRDVIGARSETRNNHIAWERLLISRFFRDRKQSTRLSSPSAERLVVMGADIAYIACGSTSLYIKTLYFFLTVLALSVAATVANIKIRYDAKIPQFAIFGTRVIYVFYSNPTQ